MTMIMAPRMIVRIYRRDLVAADACAGGLAVYDAIAKLAADAGDKRASKRLRLRWTPLHALWLASVHPDYARWLVDKGIVPSLAYASLAYASLAYASLAYASLVGARLDGASLDGARLVGARLAYASLDGASLVGASLDGASLVGASLDGASLDGASLVGARLVGARLVGASLVGASLDGARLDGASLDGCYWPKSRPAPAGWTHDPPLADREWVVLRRAPAGGEVVMADWPKCGIVVDWHCDEYGERGDEIECGASATGVHDGVPICDEHLGEIVISRDFDAARWTDLVNDAPAGERGGEG